METLQNSISVATEDAEKGVTLEKIVIQGGQESAKATALTLDFIQVCPTGEEASAQITEEEANQLALVDLLMKEDKWIDATKTVDEVLANNPTCGEAFWRKMLIANRVVSAETLAQKLDKITEIELNFLRKILNCVGEETAVKILDTFYDSFKNVPEEVYCQILKTILPYEYKNRNVKIKEAFKWAIQSSKLQAFTLLFSTFNANDVEKYIKYNCLYAKKTPALAEKKICLDKVFKIDEGNVEALKIMLYLQLGSKARYTAALKTFEKILQYTKDQSAEVSEMLDWAGKNLKTQEDCALVKQFLKYDPEDISKRKDQLLGFAKEMIKGGYFEEAEYLSKLVLSFDETNAEAYWNLCLIRVRATSDDKIKFSKIVLKDVAEYDKYLSLVEEPRRRECDKIVKNQHKEMTAKKRALVGVFTAVGAVSLAIVLAAGILITSLVIVPANRYDKAQKLLAQGKYEEAYEILEDLDDYKDADKILKESIYERAQEKMRLGEDVEAYQLLKRIKGYKETSGLMSEIRNRVKEDAQTYAQKGKYQEAIDVLDEVEVGAEYSLYRACELMLDGKYKEAVVLGLTYIIIPDGVSAIESKAFYNTDVTTVVLPRTVKTIGEGAFESCSSLQSITMSDSVTVIEDRAFYRSGLKSITLSRKLESIGASAFLGCTNLREILIPESVKTIGSQAFYQCSNIEIFCQMAEAPSGWKSNWNQCSSSSYCPVYWNYGGAMEVTKDGFTWMLLADGSGAAITEYDGYLTEVTVPETINGYPIISIYANAFEGKDDITKIQLPNTITSIGASVFSSCINLQEINLPDSVTTIGDNAFKNCTSLKCLMIPTTVTEMGENVFYGCSQVGLFCQATSQPSSWASSWNKYDNSNVCVTVWGCTEEGTTNDGLEWVSTAEGVYIIGYSGDKKSVNIPAALDGKKIVKIVDEVFKDNTTLTQVTIHSNVKSIGFGAFEGCTNLKILTVPFVGAEKNAKQNTHFGYIFGASTYSENAKYVPKSLYNVVISDTTSIASRSFEGCCNITSIELPSMLTLIGDNAFYGCYRLKRVVNLSRTLVVEPHTTTNGYVGYYTHEIVTDADNLGDFYTTASGYQFYCYPASGTYYLVSYIGDKTELTLPEGAGENDDQPYIIASYVFYNCNLKKVTIPDMVRGIDEYAFQGNNSLTSVLIKAVEECTVIDPYNATATPITLNVYDYGQTATYLKKNYLKYRWTLW